MRREGSSVSVKGSSWACKNGITREGSASGGMGLNPNLNIEDEYIENLLKQIHFMNMEIKLLKEKQSLSEGNALWGVVNRCDQPLVKNIVDSNEKYRSMRKQVDGDVKRTEYENIRLADHQNAIVKKMEYLQGKIESLQGSRKDGEQAAKNRQQTIKERLAELQDKLKQLQKQSQLESKRNTDLGEQYEGLLLESEKEQFASRTQAKKIKNDEEIESVIEGDCIGEIKAVKGKISLLTESIESSQQFQRAKESQLCIRESVTAVTKSISSAQFELLRLTESIKLAEKEKEREVLQRKKLMEEFESLKVVLKQIEELNEGRMSQEVLVRKRQSVEIQKGEYQTKKLERNLEEVKKKLGRSEEAERVLRQEVEHMETQLGKLKERREELSQTVNRLSAANDKQETLLGSCRSEYRKVQEQAQKMMSGELSSVCELNEIEGEVMLLRERREYLSSALDLKEALNETKLQELQKMVQKNRDVNETVGLLMQKWEEIKSFSKM